ncbi:MAG: sensor domain-containing protein [Rhodoferax sp.]
MNNINNQTPPDANAAPASAETGALRQQAEARWQKMSDTAAERIDDLTVAASHRLLQELRVHQIELEMQNEELSRAKLELEDSRASYLSLYELAPVGYCSVSETGLLLQANLTLANLLGVVRSKLRGLPFSKFVHQADQDRWYLLRAQLLETTLPQAVELRLRPSDGAPVWVHLSATLAQDDAGARSLRVVASDISARKQAEAALIESDARWKAAIDGLGDGLWDWHVQTGTAFYSSRYKAMYGYADADIGATANEWSQRMHPDDAPGVMAALQPCLDGETNLTSVEFRMLCKDGTWCWTLGRGMVMSRDAQGKALRMIGTNTDISERRQAAAVDQFLAQTFGDPDAEPFFAALARFLAQTLRMDYICIDRLEGDRLNATTLAVWHDGHFDDNLSYALADTPCGEVVGKQVCCFPASVCQFFPNDAALQELRAESYVGVTLWSHTGQPIGLIAAIGHRPLTNKAHAQSTLARVAVRAAGELERLDAEAALRVSEARFRQLLNDIPLVAVQGYGADGITHFWNQASEHLYGYYADEALGRSLLDTIIPAEMHEGVRHAMREMFETTRPIPAGELSLRRKDGSRVDVFSSHAYVQVPGQPPEMFCVDVDLTERKQVQARLQLAASVFSHAREGIIITDADVSILEVNDAFSRITGYDRNEVIGQNPRILKSGRQNQAFYAAMWRELLGNGHWSGEIWNRRKDGEVYAELLTISAVHGSDGQIRQYVALFSDITAIKEHQSVLERLAHFDTLTQLPNRLMLSDRLQQGMAQALRRGQQLAVAYIDLDGFKAINDAHGHDAGDLVLMALANGMKDSLREGDTLARIGGDEFVAVLMDLDDTSACLPLLNRLLAAAAAPVALGEHLPQVSASVGVTFYPQAQQVEADQLLRQADLAMYQAKVAGKNRYHVFDAVQDSSLHQHHENLERIRRALELGEFVLFYQPKVNMRSGLVTGAEALIRWQHPQRGLLAPVEFLPVIEDHPLAVAVGEWVIDTALAQVERWRAAGLELAVSVNMGTRQLQQADFVQRLQALLAQHPQLQPSCLELEILETSALSDMAQVSQVIESCAAIGVGFALDDFGTGYSSLTYLKRLRVGLLKIDQSFVRDMLHDPDDLAILQGVIGLAAAFKRQVIAEGVETVAHGSALLQLGCEQAQGYGIARPMPGDQLPAWAASWQPDAAWRSAGAPGAP